ncbi:MAG: NrsF family protein [Gammaproteobacteria bacterium]
MSKLDRTIENLVDDLTPTGRPSRPGRSALAWWLLAMLSTAAVMALIQPFRPGFVGQLTATPRFALETILGVIACFGMAWTAFALGVPDVRSPWRRARVPLVLLAIWFGLFGVALLAPVLTPSMAGKRPHCALEVLLYAAPLTLAGLMMIRRMLPLHAASTGAWTGFAAGLIPAFLMQLACMHEPLHIIKLHLAPTAGAAMVGAVLGYRLLRRQV